MAPGELTLETYRGTETSTPTPSIAISTVSVSNTDNRLLVSALAAPNISNGQQPIRFLAQLNQSAKVDLTIFTIIGEELFGAEIEGTPGLNTVIWNTQNKAREEVASGLYLYILRADDGTTQETKVGKILIIH
jgi:hypothetical protein